MYIDRKDDIYFVKWARAVKLRDHFVCQVCERRGVFLNAHHINSWDSFPDQRYDLDNGVTLCSECHHNFHKMYGYGQNTKEQFDEFRETSELLKFAVGKRLQVEDAVRAVIEDAESESKS